MATARIDLDQAEHELLQDLSRRTGRPPNELIHEALGLLAARYPSRDRLAMLRQARGIWRDRSDLPEPEVLRCEFDRFQPRAETP